MRYARIVLSGSYAETAPLTRTLLNAGRTPLFRFDRLLARVEFLLAKRSVATIIVDTQLDFRAPLIGELEAIRHQLSRLTEAGRRTVFFARSYDTATLYLASACKERLIHPLGTLRFQGLARSFLFFKRLLERYDVSTEVIRRGRFKSAGDRFRVDSIDEHNREQHEAVLRASIEELSARVAQGFGKGTEAVEELLAGRVLSAAEAVEAGWMDRALSVDALLEELRTEKAREQGLGKVRTAFGRGKKVTVLVFEGAIVDGRTRQDPVLGQAIGSQSFLAEVERLRKDKSVKGVVLRINSGGGSAMASEEIAEGLARLAEKKPLVVSMGGVAGSGGYWIAMPAERIFAEGTTITGSIGVILMLFSAREGLRRAGITESTLKIGEYADLGSPFKELSDGERGLLEDEVGRLYQRFLEKVATSRKSSAEEIDARGEGRIWAGSDARANGLIDETGGIDDALSYLKGKLGARRLKVSFAPVVRYSFIQRLIMRNAAETQMGLFGDSTGLLGALPAAADLARSFLVRSAGRPLAIVLDLDLRR